MADAERDDEVVVSARQRVGTVSHGKWTLDRLIGVGAMDAARHRNKQRAALRMLHPELSVDAGIRSRFLREGVAGLGFGAYAAREHETAPVTEVGATDSRVSLVRCW